MTPTPDRHDDAALRAALEALPPAVDPVALEALKRRVLADWSGRAARERLARPLPPAAVGCPAPAGAGGPAPGAGHRSVGAGGFGGGRGGGRRWLAAAALLLALIGIHVLTQRPDPMLEELMRVDVLSQMTAGQI